MSAFIMPQQIAHSTPSITTTSPTAFGYNFQRHTFNASGLTWYFYSDGIDMKWTSTPDYITFNTIYTAVTGVASGNLFSVFSNGPYVAYVRVTTAGVLYYRYGITQTNGSIVWLISETKIKTNNYYVTAPSVCIDTAGYLWIGYCNSNGVIGGNATYTAAYVMRSDRDNGTVGYPMPIELERSLAFVQYGVCPTPTVDGHVIVAYGSDSTPLKTKSFNSAYGLDGEPLGSILEQGIKTLSSIVFDSGYSSQSENCLIQLNSISTFTASATMYSTGSGPVYGTFIIYYSDGTTLTIQVPLNGDVLGAIYKYNAEHGISNAKVITKITYNDATMWENFSSDLEYYVDGIASHDRYGGDDYYGGVGTLNYIKTLPAIFVWHSYVNSWYYTTDPITGRDIIYYNFTSPLSSTELNNIGITYQTDPSHTLQLNCTVVYGDHTSTKTIINVAKDKQLTSPVSFVGGKSVTSFVVSTSSYGFLDSGYEIQNVLFNSTNTENSLNNAVSDGTYLYESLYQSPLVIKKLTVDGLFPVDVWQYNSTLPANNTLVYDAGFLYIGCEGYGNLVITKVNAVTMKTAQSYKADPSYNLDYALGLCSDGTYLYALARNMATNHLVVVKILESTMTYDSKDVTSYIYVGTNTIMYDAADGNVYISMSQASNCAAIQMNTTTLSTTGTWSGAGYGANVYSSSAYGSFIYIGVDSKIVKINITPFMLTVANWSVLPSYHANPTSIVNDGTYLYTVYNYTTPVLTKIDINTMSTISYLLPSVGGKSAKLIFTTGIFDVCFDSDSSATSISNYMLCLRTSVFNTVSQTSYSLKSFSSFSCVNKDNDVFIAYTTSTNKIDSDFYSGEMGAITAETILYTSLGTAPSPTISRNSYEDISVIWMNDPVTDKIYYNIYRNSTSSWSGVTVGITSSGITTGTPIISVYQSFSPTGVGWMTGAGPPYTIVVNGLLTGDEPTLNYLVVPDLSAGISTFRNIYSMDKYYTFVASTTTVNSPNDVTDIYITAMKGAQIYFKVHGASLNTVPVWSIISNSTIINLDTAHCVWAKSGTLGTATFKIETKWNFPTTADLDLYLEAVNGAGSSGIIKMQTAYCDVISDLVATITTTTPQVFLGVQIAITGGVFYEISPANINLYTVMVSPPDAQFTRVEVWNKTLVAQDPAIVNGTYQVVFTPYLATGNQTYHLKLFMLLPFVAGPSANNATLTVYVTANFVPSLSPLTILLQPVFNLFGIGGGVVAIWAMITSIGIWFVASITMMVSFVTTLGTMFFNFAVFLFTWISIMGSFIIALVTIMINLLNGTSTAITYGGNVVGSISFGLGNIWNLFGGTNLIIFMPFVIFIVWIQSLDSRQETMGIGLLSLALNDFQTLYGLINVLTGFAMFIYSVVSDWIRWIFGYLSGFFTRLFSSI